MPLLQITVARALIRPCPLIRVSEMPTHYLHSSPDGPGGQFSGLAALQRRKSEIRAERPGRGRRLPLTELLMQKAAVG